jgi:hypothetical protein
MHGSDWTHRTGALCASRLCCRSSVRCSQTCASRPPHRHAHAASSVDGRTCTVNRSIELCWSFCCCFVSPSSSRTYGSVGGPPVEGLCTDDGQAVGCRSDCSRAHKETDMRSGAADQRRILTARRIHERGDIQSVSRERRAERQWESKGESVMPKPTDGFAWICLLQCGEDCPSARRYPLAHAHHAGYQR